MVDMDGEKLVGAVTTFVKENDVVNKRVDELQERCDANERTIRCLEVVVREAEEKNTKRVDALVRDVMEKKLSTSLVDLAIAKTESDDKCHLLEKEVRMLSEKVSSLEMVNKETIERCEKRVKLYQTNLCHVMKHGKLPDRPPWKNAGDAVVYWEGDVTGMRVVANRPWMRPAGVVENVSGIVMRMDEESFCVLFENGIEKESIPSTGEGVPYLNYL